MASGAGMLDDEEDEDLFAYTYGADFPQAITVMGSALLGGRPTNTTLGPVQQLKILVGASEYRAATPRRPGKGKPLPPSEFEGEQETESRKAAQKACQRLILPKPKGETPDCFIRRLDAHRNAPEALIAPMQTPAEDEVLFAKRCIAVKETAEMPNVLILPKTERETAAEFEERLAAAKKSPTLLFPRGAHESNAQWKVRLGFAAKCKRTILPRSSDEPERGFRDRCEAQLSCMKVMHPYDPKREDEKSFYRRIEANKERTAFAFEPGDTKAINGVLGEEKQKKKAEADGSTPAPAAADDLAKQMAEMAKVREAEDAAEAAAAAKEEEGKAKAAEEAAEAERVEARIADMKKKQQEMQEAKEREEKEAAKSFDVERIAINQIGFMPLKKLLMERGVPKEQVFGAANKFALMEVAKKWADTLKIEWVEEEVAVS